MKAQDIKAGMRTPWWVALSDAVVDGDTVSVRIESVPDGGRETREWDRDADVPQVSGGN